jgi:hypothetical protein
MFSKLKEKLGMDNKEEISGEKEMGKMEIISYFIDLLSSNILPVHIRKMEKLWKPLIDQIEKVVEEVKKQNKPLLDLEMPGPLKPPTDVSQFLDIAKRMMARGKALLEKVDYDLYVVKDETEAAEIKSAHAVIVYSNSQGKYFARVVNEKLNKNVTTEMPDKQKNKLLKYLKNNEKKKVKVIADNKEVILSENSIDMIDEITCELVEKANIKNVKKNRTELVSGGVKLLEDVPAFFQAFEKLGLHDKVKKQLDALEEILKNFNFGNTVQAIKKKSDEFILKIENELEKVLDEKIYELYFTKETPVDEKSHWIQQVGNAFVNIKEIIKKIESKEVDDVIKEGKKFITALRQIKENPDFNKLISMKRLEEIVPGDLTKEQANFMVEKAKAFLNNIKSASAPLAQLMQTVAATIEEELNASQDKSLKQETVTAFKNITVLVTNLAALYEKLDKQADEKPDLLGFAITHFSKIMNVMNSLPQILATLDKLSIDKAKKIAIETNGALKTLMLLGDKLEIEFCLKQGYFTEKLAPMMSAYHKKVIELGYDFKLEERYPYAVAMAKQREELLKDSLPVQKKLINIRMESVVREELQASQESIGEDAQIRKAQKREAEIKQAINAAIEEHIERIKDELKEDQELKKDSIPDKNKETKISLLEILISKNQYINLEDRLKDLRTQHPETIHLLYEGNTGRILKKLEFKNSSPEDIFNELNKELAGLKKQRGTTHYIFRMHKAQLLEKRISACEKLQAFLKKSNLRNALISLDSEEKRTLQQYDSGLLDNLELINAALPVAERPKEILGAKKENDPVPAEVVKEISPEQAYALALIENRIKELDKAMFQTATNRAKAILLQELVMELMAAKTLDRALEKIKTGDHALTAHLLFEGRTGKAIKAAQNAVITRDELIHRIDAEISALKQKRYAHLRVFAKSRKGSIDAQIQSLQKLKVTIKDTEGSVKEVIAHLKPEDKVILQRYEAALLKDLKGFETLPPTQKMERKP